MDRQIFGLRGVGWGGGYKISGFKNYLVAGGGGGGVATA